MFRDRRLLIATKHKKEAVLAPLLEKSLEVKCTVSEKFDTDTLGTFSGEVERKEGSVVTARQKCLLAMELYDCDLGVASEGSFGPHPLIPFMTANEEFLIFLDRKNDLEIIVKEVETNTNFAVEEIKTRKDLVLFAKRVKFPSHALVLRSFEKRDAEIIKGITIWESLNKAFDHLVKDHGSVFVETDMRAMYNPTRMKVIAKAGEKLVNKVKSCCPTCSTPGFGIVSATAGLPCNLCGSPTHSILSHLHECQKCLYRETEQYPLGKKTEDPEFCDRCNP